MSTVRILEGALQTLRTRGWHQGRYQGPEGRVCVLGACHVGVGVDARDWPSASQFDEYVDAIVTLTRLAGPHIPDWNDTPGRTFAEVEALLTAAIALASEQGSGCRIEAVLA